MKGESLPKTPHCTDLQPGKPIRIFRPRPSFGWFWLVLMAVILIAVGIAPALATGVSSSTAILTLLICIPVALTFLILAFWFPTMRYGLDHDLLTLYYDPVLKYRIPLGAIRTIRRRNLSLTIWSSIRFPGIALFKIPYGDVGNVKMCATAALNKILLIETEKDTFGLTPTDVEAFVTEIRVQMEA